MTRDEFKKLTTDEAWAYVENCQEQSIDAIGRIEAYDTEKADLAKKAADELKATQDKAAADLAEAKATHDAAVATMEASHATALAEKVQQLTEAQTLIDALGSTELGQKLLRQKQREELAAKIAAAEKAKKDAADALAAIPVDA